MSISFPSVTSIMSWAKSAVMYLGGDPKTPFILKDNLYHYFSYQDDGGIYKLFATSERDLNRLEKK